MKFTMAFSTLIDNNFAIIKGAAMQVTHEFNHDIELVFKTLTDPVFLKQRALSLGNLDANCDANGEPSNCQLKLVRQRQINVPAVLSAFVKKFKSPRQSSNGSDMATTIAVTIQQKLTAHPYQ
ncbi:MAG: hypothetical protein ACJAQ6_001569 [Arenicella sp.]|jgi:hypothetical protein